MAQAVPAGLGKPDIPPARNLVQRGSDWNSIWKAFTQLTTYLSSLTVYLQTYLTRVYNALVPLQFPSQTISNAQSPYSVQNQDVFLAVAASASAPTQINLPPAGGTSRVIIVKKTDANVENVTLQAAGSDRIDGVGTYSLAAQWNAVAIEDAAAGQWLIWSKV